MLNEMDSTKFVYFIKIIQFSYLIAKTYYSVYYTLFKLHFKNCFNSILIKQMENSEDNIIIVFVTSLVSYLIFFFLTNLVVDCRHCFMFLETKKILTDYFSSCFRFPTTVETCSSPYKQ